MPEYRIPPSLLGFAFVIQEIIIFAVDEKLGAGTVRIRRPSHRNGAALVGQSVVGFIADWGARLFFVHVDCKTTPLNHEIGDHAMKDGVVVKFRVDIR